MTLDAEDSAAGFLGVQVRYDDDTGKITMTQTGLIDRIITALGCDDLEEADTPVTEVLGKDEHGSCNLYVQLFERPRNDMVSGTTYKTRPELCCQSDRSFCP